jgi:hypothetical protein
MWKDVSVVLHEETLSINLVEIASRDGSIDGAWLQ